MKITDVNIVYEEPHEDYLQRPGLSFSALKTFIESPELYKAQHIERSVEQKTSDEMQFGTALHAYVLLGRETMDKEVAIMPDFGSLRLKKNRDARDRWLAENAGHRAVITAADWLLVEHIGKAIADCPEAIGAIDFFNVETSVTWNADGMPCRGRMDSWSFSDGEGVVVDLKTTRNSHPDSFLRELFDRRYHQQMAWYIGPLREKHGGNWTAKIIAVPKTMPCVPRVYHLTENTLKEAEQLNEEIMAHFIRCVKTKDWSSRDRLIVV